MPFIALGLERFMLVAREVRIHQSKLLNGIKSTSELLRGMGPYMVVGISVPSWNNVAGLCVPALLLSPVLFACCVVEN